VWSRSGYAVNGSIPVKVNAWFDSAPPSLTGLFDFSKGKQMELTLKKQWVERLKLMAQGNTLWAQGNTLRAQGNTLLAQGDTLRAQGDTLRAQGNTLMAQGNTLMAQGNTLMAQGNTLLAQGDTLRAQGDTLWAQGDTLRAQGNTLWANAIIEAFGNIKLKITYENGVNYELENGEIYRSDMPIEGD
jgi:OstA-like protein